MPNRKTCREGAGHRRARHTEEMWSYGSMSLQAAVVARAEKAERVGEPTGAGELLFIPGVLGGEPGVEEGGEVSLNRFSLSDSETYSARMVANSPGSSRVAAALPDSRPRLPGVSR